MIKIGLLSDTHGFIDESVYTFFNNVDEIWHAGDIGNNIIERLTEFKPTRAVYGNIDDQLIRLHHKEKELFEIENVKVLMVHIGGYPGKYAPGIEKLIKLHKPNLFIAGHSHILKVIFDKKNQCLHLNPGAAGISGFHALRTMLRFTIDQTEIKELEIWQKDRK